MHRSIGVTLILIVSVLVPRQARAVDPITGAVVAIIGTTSAALDLKDRYDIWAGLVESDSSMIKRIIDKDLLAAQSLMEQYNNAPNNKKLLQDARTHFTRAAGGYEGRLDGTAMYKRALSWLGVNLCCDAIDDRSNAQLALVEIIDIGLLPESTAKKKIGRNYVKYIAIWEAVLANLMQKGTYEPKAISDHAIKLLSGKKGIPKDHAAGFRFMRLAAKHTGGASAQYIVGDLYKDGVGVQRNYSQAADWYRKAAEQGHSRARSELGNLYLNGRGVPKNVIEGTAWAALSSMNEARKYNIRISGVTLSSGDKIKVKKRVPELFKKYGKTK